jgi:FkbM family methyltransferase
MFVLSKVKSTLRSVIAAHRRSRLIRGIHNVATFVDSAWRNEGSEFASNGERFVLQRLKHVGFRLAIDAGANLGDWSREALALWPNCKVHAFEVAPATFEGLEAGIHCYRHRDRIKLHQVGLSDQPSVQTMYYYPECPQLTCDIHRHDRYKAVPFEANLTTLDDFCDTHQIGSVDFLKIDVEGAEHRVLKGFSKHLAADKVSCIQFEYGAFSIETRFLLQDYYKLLSSQFWIGKIFPNHVDFQDYDWRTEDFRFCNYLCITRTHPELRDLFKG